jgi:hypothetical protein
MRTAAERKQWEVGVAQAAVALTARKAAMQAVVAEERATRRKAHAWKSLWQLLSHRALATRGGVGQDHALAQRVTSCCGQFSGAKRPRRERHHFHGTRAVDRLLGL